MGIALEMSWRDTAFDPDTLQILCQAYDNTLLRLGDSGQPRIVKEVIAERIISLASRGERDPDRLCAEVLSRALTPAHRSAAFAMSGGSRRLPIDR